ncbi:hypothetical protein AAMO2058_000007000 [Amorphochlora amoebiformis]
MGSGPPPTLINGLPRLRSSLLRVDNSRAPSRNCIRRRKSAAPLTGAIFLATTAIFIVQKLRGSTLATPSFHPERCWTPLRIRGGSVSSWNNRDANSSQYEGRTYLDTTSATYYALQLTGIPENTTEDDLLQEFSRFGHLLSTRVIPTKERMVAYCNFRRRHNAFDAYSRFQEKPLLNIWNLSHTFLRPPKMRPWDLPFPPEVERKWRQADPNTNCPPFEIHSPGLLSYITKTGRYIEHLQRCFKKREGSICLKFRYNNVLTVKQDGALHVSTGGFFNNGTFLTLQLGLTALGLNIECPSGPNSSPFIISDGSVDFILRNDTTLPGVLANGTHLLPFRSPGGQLSGSFLLQSTAHLRDPTSWTPIPPYEMADRTSWKGGGGYRGGGGRDASMKDISKMMDEVSLEREIANAPDLARSFFSPSEEGNKTSPEKHGWGRITEEELPTKGALTIRRGWKPEQPQDADDNQDSNGVIL